MYIANSNKSAINAELWRAWLKKGKLRDRKRAGQTRVLGGVSLAVLGIGMAFYLLAGS
jgi:hypothetical protein